MEWNRQLDQFPASEILAFSKWASSQPDVISLTIGEPDLDTPVHIKQAGAQAIRDNASHYTESRGEAVLRESVAAYLEKRYGLHYAPESQILITHGATEGLAVAFKTLLNPGDKVIIPAPAYTGYEPNVLLNHAEAIFADTSQTGFLLTPQLLRETVERAGKVKAVVLNSPNNPTGAAYSRRQLQDLAREIKRLGLFVISDEVYSELTYAEDQASIAQFLPEHTFYINSVSKTFAMTGWRIGILAGPALGIAQAQKVHELYATSATTISQRAAREAFQNGAASVQAVREVFRRRRDVALLQLEQAGLSVVRPRGTFYLFIKIPDGYGENSVDFCRELALTAKVAVLPGSFFGPEGEGFFRLSYTVREELLQEALVRIGNYVNEKTRMEAVK